MTSAAIAGWARREVPPYTVTASSYAQPRWHRVVRGNAARIVLACDRVLTGPFELMPEPPERGIPCRRCALPMAMSRSPAL
jgi:hypothetical protein